MPAARVPEALSLPRSVAFNRGLLVPVSRWQRRDHGIPFPVRFTATAWQLLIDIPPSSRSGKRPDPRVLGLRLDRFLAALRDALGERAAFRRVADGVGCLHLAAPPPLGAGGPPRHVELVLSRNEEDEAVLTVVTPEEWQLPS